MAGRHFREGQAPAVHDRRAAGEAFQAILVERATAGERICLVIVRRIDVAHLEMACAGEGASILQDARADARADGDIGERGVTLPGAVTPLAERGAVDVRIYRDRAAEPAQPVDPAGACPAWLWRALHRTIGRRAGVDIDRAKGGDADRAQPTM